MESKTNSLIVKNKENKGFIIAYICVLILLVIVMFFYIGKKEGFHCDEIFSYGSSNSKDTNTFSSYSKIDPIKLVLKKYIIKDNIIETAKNLKYYYIDNPEAREELAKQEEANQNTSWRTKEEAREYMVADDNNRFNYLSVYYNQIRDVHPPLFYVIVHTISSIFSNTFSKYIIFSINLLFFLGTCEVIRRIMIKLDKRNLSIFTVAFYGFSMGAISTVIFQRMYMMLTFFTILFLYLHICISKNDYIITKKMKFGLILTTVLGFLTQYYFCIYAFLIAIVMSCILLKKKKYKELKRYILTLVISAVIGLLIFPFSIYHIFFSYRGVGSIVKDSYFTRLGEYLKFIIYAFSSNLSLVLEIFVLIIIAGIIKRKKNIELFLLLIVPTIFMILIITKISPFLELRYIMNVLPIISILIILAINNLSDNEKYGMILVSVVVVGISLYGLFTSKPLFLYEGYNKYIEISEKNSDLDYVFVGYTFFNHIQSLPEFMNYKDTLMISKEEVYKLIDNPNLKDKNEFILSVNKYLGNEEILKEVLDVTHFKNYEVITEGIEGIDNVVYRIYK